MTRKSVVKSVETLSCDAGWRNYHFVKVVTEDGITGWSEFDEGFGAPGVTTAIERLSARVIGSRLSARTYLAVVLRDTSCRRRRWRWRLAPSRTRCSTKAKALGRALLRPARRKIRDRVRVIGRTATWRINHPDWKPPPAPDGVKAIGREVREKALPR